MIATCTITRSTGDGSWNPVTGGTSPAPTTVYSGKCKLRQPSPTDRQQVAGGFDWSLQDSILSLPITATGVRVKDVITMVTSPLNPGDVGAKLEVAFIPRGTYVTARRFIVREAP